MTKVLVSPGFGAGFVTWASEEYQARLASDPVLVALVEAGKHTEDEGGEFAARVTELCGAGAHVYLGGVGQLQVTEVNGPYRYTEYDGSESIITQEETRWFNG